jgi:Fe/S biogenesis protein NfuA
MITFTPLAVEKIAELMRAEGKTGQFLRIAIQGRGQGGFAYRLGFVDAAERADGDTVVEAGPFQALVDADSAPDLAGTTIDYVETPVQSGFRIDNPNPLWRDPTAQAVQKVLDDDINPAVGSHGGWVTLLDVRDGVAYIQLGGGCQGCGMADVTLKQGIEVRIRELVPAIREIIDSTDHAGGTNPYYRPAKGGGSSPLAR